jgi:hypothetical protein
MDRIRLQAQTVHHVATFSALILTFRERWFQPAVASQNLICKCLASVASLRIPLITYGTRSERRQLSCQNIRTSDALEQGAIAPR